MVKLSAQPSSRPPSLHAAAAATVQGQGTGSRDSGDWVYGGGLPCFAVSGTRRQHKEGRATRRWSSYFSQIVFAVATFPSLGPPPYLSPYPARARNRIVPCSTLPRPHRPRAPPRFHSLPSLLCAYLPYFVLLVPRPPARLLGHHEHRQLMQSKVSEAHKTYTQTGSYQRDRKRRYSYRLPRPKTDT